MINTIIVPMDGSELAEQVLPCAGQVAQHTGAGLLLLQVLPTDASAALKEEAFAYLDEVAKNLDQRVQTEIRLGNPANEIMTAAGAVPEPIIAMTTHGRGGLGRLLYGSVADQVVRDANVPVFLIRSGAVPATPCAIHSILVPLDGSAYAEAALPYAAELARVFDADLWLAQVADTTSVTEDPAVAEKLAAEYQQAVRDANAYLHTLADRFSRDGIRVHPRVLAGFTEDELLQFGKETAADLIVMASHGRSGLRRFGSRSLAERLLRLGTAPVLMVRPAGVAWTEGSRPAVSGGLEAEAPQPAPVEEAKSVSPSPAPEREVAPVKGETSLPAAWEAEAARWEIDPAHSEIEFSIRHLMISTIKGRFNRFSGFIAFTHAEALPAAVEVEIDVASIDTGQEQRDIHLRSGDFFDVETYPTILFVSRRIDLLSADHFRIVGDLRMHGVTRPVTLEAIFLGFGRDPWGQQRASFTATTRIDRRDFGITWNQPLEAGGIMIGDTVTISLNIEAVKREIGMAGQSTGEAARDA